METYRSVLLFATLVFAAGSTPAAAFQTTSQKFRIVDLGTLPGGGSAAASAINNYGAIAGSAMTAQGQQHAVLWTAGARNVLDLHPQGYQSSAATGINAAGQVVLNASGPNTRAYIWYTGRFTEVAAPGYTFDALAINALGRVAGDTRATGQMLPQASYWTGTGGLVRLDPAANGGLGTGVNTAGQVAGWVWLSGHGGLVNIGALLWPAGGGEPRQLGTLASGTQSKATGINDNGDVAGYSTLSASSMPAIHAFLWTAQAGMRDLGTLGTDNSYAAGLNLRREVVGYTLPQNGAGFGRAFYWSPAGGIQQLPGLAGGAAQALAINDGGQIVGTSIGADGNAHAVVWTKVLR
jgi:probable HAF family extracellular repeat protein